MHDTSKFNLSLGGFSGVPQVYSFELLEGIHGDDQLTVFFVANGSLSNSIVGGEANFSFESEGKKEFFNGVVTNCSSRQSATDASTVTLKVKTVRHLLDKEKKRAVFCDSDVEEITKKILGKSGILNAKCKFNSFYKTDLKIQHNETDLAFLQRLFEEYGIMEYVKHSEKGSRLVISDGNDFEASNLSFVDSDLEFSEKGNVFHGYGHVPVRPGMEFESWSGTTFVVASASHFGNQAAAYGIKTGKKDGYACHISAFPKNNLKSLPRSRTAPFHSSGVMLGTVEGFSDSPAALDSEGRYIIRMEFDKENPDRASSIPVHLMQNFAGEGCGFHFPLRKDTPVLVAFENGNLEKPVILGTLPKDTHQGPATESNSFQNIVKTSSGIELIFDDQTKSASLTVPKNISAKAGKDTALESVNKLILKADDMSLDGRNKIFAKADKEITLESGESLVIAGGKVRISMNSDGALEIEASDVAMKASSKLVLKGATVDISGPSSPSPDAGEAASQDSGREAVGGSGGGIGGIGIGGIGNGQVPLGGVDLLNGVGGGAVPLGIAGGSSSVSQGTETTAQSDLLVKKVEGAEKTYPRQKIVYKAEYNKTISEMTTADKEKKIQWAVKVGDAPEEPRSENSEKITLDIDKDWEGKEIVVMACIENTPRKSQKTKVLQETSKSTLIRGVEGEDDAAPNQKIEYKVTNSNKDGEAGNVENNSGIRWAIKIGKNGSIDGKMLEGETGENLTLKIRKEWAGKEILVMPFLRNATETVSVKTKVYTSLAQKVTEMLRRMQIDGGRVQLAIFESDLYIEKLINEVGNCDMNTGWLKDIKNHSDSIEIQVGNQLGINNDVLGLNAIERTTGKIYIIINLNNGYFNDKDGLNGENLQKFDQELQIILLHEFVHAWQGKINWLDRVKHKGRKIEDSSENSPVIKTNIYVEVEAYDLQFEYEKKVNVCLNTGIIITEIRKEFKDIGGNYSRNPRDRSDLTEEAKLVLSKKADFLLTKINASRKFVKP